MKTINETENPGADHADAVELADHLRSSTRLRSHLKIAAGVMLIIATGGSLALLSPGGNAVAGANDKQQPRAVQNQPQEKKPGVQPQRSADPAPGSVQAGAGQPAEGIFSENATKIGATTCAGFYGALGKDITLGTTFAVQTQTAGSDPAEHATLGLIGMNFNNPNDYAGPGSGVVLAVPTAKGCEGNMVKIVPFPQSCVVAQSSLPEGSNKQTPIMGMDVFGLPGGSQAMFMPSTGGCVIVTVARR
ncbi:hypothetical protein [Agrobacterium sp. DE0009]|uniref:hypothetical protein n=1 Tax=Agrobacterium sp. DE0009 TaxID=2587505 RepID=UPI00119EDB85|nr:hypothetical protein [Agrobacterium sp. DE0009]